VLGILKVAFKLLVNDRGKFVALLTGITFAVFLMVQMTSIFAGILRKAAATVTNTGAKLWVLDPGVNNVASSIPMPDYVLDAVRSLPGVKFAVPFFSGAALVKLRDGTYQPVTVLGLDDTTLFGRPRLLEGRIQDIYRDYGYLVVKDEEYPKLEKPGLGTSFELNDNRCVIVGIAKLPASGLFGLPTLYTTYTRAVQDVPTERFTLSFVLAEAASPADLPAIQASVARLGYQALTDQEFIGKITRFYTWHTGLGMNILLMTGIAFVVGLSISGQAFYSFTLENLEKFGALKAIGAKGRELVYMILTQAGVTALGGYGLGVGLTALLITLAKLRIPEYASIVTFGNLLLAFGMVLVISAFTSWFAVRRVLKIEPFEVFRG
jgi:putative ABC transport system permease protein